MIAGLIFLGIIVIVIPAIIIFSEWCGGSDRGHSDSDYFGY